MNTEFTYRGHTVELRQIDSNPLNGNRFAINIDEFPQNLDPFEEFEQGTVASLVAEAKKLIDEFEDAVDQARDKDLEDIPW